MHGFAASPYHSNHPHPGHHGHHPPHHLSQLHGRDYSNHGHILAPPPSHAPHAQSLSNAKNHSQSRAPSNAHGFSQNSSLSLLPPSRQLPHMGSTSGSSLLSSAISPSPSFFDGYGPQRTMYGSMYYFDVMNDDRVYNHHGLGLEFPGYFDDNFIPSSSSQHLSHQQHQQQQQQQHQMAMLQEQYHRGSMGHDPENRKRLLRSSSITLPMSSPSPSSSSLSASLMLPSRPPLSIYESMESFSSGNNSTNNGLIGSNAGIDPGSRQYAMTQKCRQLPCRTWISTGSCPYGDRCVFLHDPRVISKSVPIKCRRKSQEDLCQDSLFWPTMTRESVSSKLDNRNLPHISQHYIVPHPASVNNNVTDGNYIISSTTTVGTTTTTTTLSPRDCDLLLSNWGSLSIGNLGATTTSLLTNNNSTITITPASTYDPTKDPRHVGAVYSMWSHFLDICATDENSVVKEPRLVAKPDPWNAYNLHTGNRRLRVFMDLSRGSSLSSSLDSTSTVTKSGTISSSVDISESTNISSGSSSSSSSNESDEEASTVQCL